MKFFQAVFAIFCIGLGVYSYVAIFDPQYLNLITATNVCPGGESTCTKDNVFLYPLFLIGVGISEMIYLVFTPITLWAASGALISTICFVVYIINVGTMQLAVPFNPPEMKEFHVNFALIGSIYFFIFGLNYKNITGLKLSLKTKEKFRNIFWYMRVPAAILAAIALGIGGEGKKVILSLMSLGTPVFWGLLILLYSDGIKLSASATDS